MAPCESKIRLSLAANCEKHIAVTTTKVILQTIIFSVYDTVMRHDMQHEEHLCSLEWKDKYDAENNYLQSQGLVEFILLHSI